MKTTLRMIGVVALILAILGFIFLVVWGISKIPGPTYMTNDEIISETKKCENAGMIGSQLVNGWNYKVTSVICQNK